MPHIYETQITNEDNLKSVLNAIEHFNYDRLLCALQGRRSLSVADIVGLDASIMEATAKLQSEYANLQEAAPTFNKCFVHKNNHYFSSTESLLRKIRSGMARFKGIYTKLTPNNAASTPSLPEGNVKPLIYDRSALGNAEYTPNLFPDDVRPEVKKLYEDLVSFLSVMEDALFLCQDVIDREKDIRKDANQCLDLYINFKDEHYSHIKQLLKQITASWNDIEKMTNPAIALREQTNSDADFSQKGFHNLEYDDVCTLATKEIVEESQRGEFTKEELMLFFNDKQKILIVRHIINQFDSFLDEQYLSHKKLPAKYIAILLLWAQPKEDYAFVKYFKKTYTQSNDKYLVPDNPSVNQQKNALISSDSDYIRLVRVWDAIKI